MQFTLTTVLLTVFMAYSAAGQSLAVQQASYKHKPIVEMTINNKKTWVLLDTGSDITILDINTKKAFGFTSYEKEGYKVPGFGSENNQLHRANDVNLKFGNTQLRCPMYAFDISNISESIQARTGKRITAIIGTHLMRTYGFVIDMGNDTVVMYSKIKKGKSQKNITYASLNEEGYSLKEN